MNTSMRKWLLPPAFADQDKTRAAALLNAVLVAASAINLLNLIGVTLYSPFDTTGLVVSAIGLVLLLALYMLMRLGSVQQAALLLCAGFWAAQTLALLHTGGISNPNYANYLLIIVAAALLLGSRAAVLFTALSIGMGYVLTYHVALTGTLGAASENNWFAFSSLFVLLLLLQMLAQHSIRQGLDEAERVAQALSDNNLALYREILERREIESALRDSEERYRRLMTMTPMPVFVNTLENHVLFANPAALELLGAKNEQEITEQPLINYVLPEYRALAHERLHLVNMEQPTANAEMRMHSRDGRVLDVEVRSVPVEFRTQRAVLTVMRDITERNEVQRQMLEAQRLQLELDKERQILRLKEGFISMISHEFRTPLTVVSSSAEILDTYKERLTTAQREGHLGKIKRQVERMVTMLDDILMLSKANAGMLEFYPIWLPLASFCRELCAEFASSQPDLPAVDLDLRKLRHEIVLADEQMLRFMLLNLLSNAAKYSPRGSTIHVTLQSEGENVVITVRDEGIGIPQEEQEHLFEPFYRATNARTINGTGLGLAIVKHGVDAHKGSIRVNSVLGSGTTFTLWLPLATVQEEAKQFTG